MKKTGKALKLVLFNWMPLVGFELLYKMMSVLFFIPLLAGIFNTVMRISGYSYLTLENVGSFLLNPLTLLALAALLVLAAVFAMIDISAIVFTLDQSMQRNHVSIGQILRFALRNSLRVWKPENVLLVPMVLVFLPFVNIGFASGLLTTLSVPEFIMDYIKANGPLLLLFTAVVALLTALVRRWLYAFYYFTLEGSSFSEARRKSAALGKGKRLRDFGALFGMQALFSVVYFLFLFLLIALGVLLGNGFSDLFLLKWISSAFVWLAVAVALAVAAALALPFGYGCIGVLYYRRKAETGEAVIHSKVPVRRENLRHQKAFRALKAGAACVIAAGSLILGFLLSTGRLRPEIEYVRTMEVTAHRGASAFYPENTMAAFIGAREMGADWIELDVQQSRDGQIMVIHDTNLKRTTGVNANTWEMDYAEIARLDAGSFFGEAFAGERIPLLSEVVAFAKENDIKLNIELKPTGHETDFEKNVVDVVREAGFGDSCVITSQVYEVLEKVKAYDASMTTVYVMSLAYGDINSLSAADHFSVEATSATKTLVSRVHNEGKELYAWTVNTKESITKMIELNVDNIITDDIELARQCIYESRYSSLLMEYVKLFQ